MGFSGVVVVNRLLLCLVTREYFLLAVLIFSESVFILAVWFILSQTDLLCYKGISCPETRCFWQKGTPQPELHISAVVCLLACTASKGVWFDGLIAFTTANNRCFTVLCFAGWLSGKVYVNYTPHNRKMCTLW